MIIHSEISVLYLVCPAITPAVLSYIIRMRRFFPPLASFHFPILFVSQSLLPRWLTNRRASRTQHTYPSSFQDRFSLTAAAKSTSHASDVQAEFPLTGTKGGGTNILIISYVW
ncbi:hypothetical protein F5887DRAFT_296211 [Amanita rubescens]|nr:hypothetical protein F5887DRAFT_296211 [Amanita rubescens]